jgi:hypothetical protein
MVLGFVAALCSASVAHASGKLDPSYLYDGGAIPLLWVPFAGTIAVDAEVAPRATPLGFGPNEGGAAPSSWEVPSWSVTLAGVGVASLYVAGGDATRWDHAKGLVEAMATSAFVASLIKPVVGRHRPDWNASTPNLDEDESFMSGHTTEAFAIATYSALYLHAHVAGDQRLAEIGLLSGACLIAAERVFHKRHHISDVAAGVVLGSATSYLIYRFQDARASGNRTQDWVGSPSLDARASTFSLSGQF